MSHHLPYFLVAAFAFAPATALAQPAPQVPPNTGTVFHSLKDFSHLDGGDVPYYQDKRNRALAIRANISEYRDRFATVTRTFDGDSGTYDVTITTLTEEDGESTYRLLVNQTVVGVFKNRHIGAGSKQDMQPQTHVWRSVRITQGDAISIQSNTTTNGEIPEDGGTAWSRGRWRQIELTRSAKANKICPPAGRLAIVADGNSPDPDDIGATAVIFGLLKATGLNDRLVHLSHSCDLRPVNRISKQDELRRQQVMHQVCTDGVTRFGPYKNLDAIFNCRTNQQGAVDDLRDAINESSSSDPLWIIEAGEPDIIGYALADADAARRRHVHVVSHHPANDNAGDFYSWQQILDFGVAEHQIGDQNIGLKTAISPWDWAKTSPDPNMQWIHEQLAYAEQDGVVKFQTDHFDCSDAGMVYWWITGANNAGIRHATSSQIELMLRMESRKLGKTQNDFDQFNVLMRVVGD